MKSNSNLFDYMLLKEALVKEYTEKFKEPHVQGGGEGGHIEADDLLCELLTDLGFEEIVELYNKIPDMWYS